MGNLTSLDSSVITGSEYPGLYDYIAATYPTTTSEVFTYKLGGASGETVGVVTITYTDDSKCDVSTIVRA